MKLYHLRYVIFGGLLISLIMHQHADATIMILSHWRMGEESGDTDGRLDSVGTRHFLTNSIPTEFTTSVSPAGDNYSSVAVNARGGAGSRAGFYGVDTTSFMPADNWGIEMWVRTANTTQSIDIMTPNGTAVTDNLKFNQAGGVWTASYHGTAWIGATSGAGQTATAEQWTHLAVVRDGGISTLYIDGTAQAGTPSTVPVWGTSMHLGVLSGGGSGWNGDLDEVRAFSFSPGQFNVNDLLLPVPEPSTLALSVLGLLSLGFVGWRRRRRA